MSIPSVASFLNGPAGLGHLFSARQKSPLDSGPSERDAIREKGLTAWAHEQKMETLKARVRAQVLSERNMTEESLANLASELRTSVEDEVAKLVTQRMQEVMEQEAEDAARTGKTEAVFLDIMA